MRRLLLLLLLLMLLHIALWWIAVMLLYSLWIPLLRLSIYLWLHHWLLHLCLTRLKGLLVFDHFHACQTRSAERDRLDSSHRDELVNSSGRGC